MTIPLLGRLLKSRAPPEESRAHGGYFALHDAFGDAYDEEDFRPAQRHERTADRFSDWDARLAGLDGALPGVVEVPRHDTRWWRVDYWRGRRKRWWAGRIVAGLLGLFILLVAWLAITAPLNKSLQPIVPGSCVAASSDPRSYGKVAGIWKPEPMP